jgi:hypothetical protein
MSNSRILYSSNGENVSYDIWEWSRFLILAMRRHLRQTEQTVVLSSIDYRCNNRRFWLSAANWQVPFPTSHHAKPRTRTANLDIWSWLTHQVLGKLKSTISNLQIYSPKKANSEKLGVGIDDPCNIVFLSLRTNKCLERVNDWHFWDPGVFSYAMIQDVAPTQEIFHCHIYIVYVIFPLCTEDAKLVDYSLFQQNLGQVWTAFLFSLMHFTYCIALNAINEVRLYYSDIFRIFPHCLQQAL